MRKRQVVVLVAVMYFVMAFGVLGGEARSGIHVTRIPKHKLSLYLKAVGEFKYNAKLNTWMSSDPKEHPVIFKPKFIGRKKLPAYYEGGNMMADPCDNSYYIITDQSYAIRISTDCGGGSDVRLGRYLKSFSLPKGVHAIRAKEEKGWEVIDQE